MGRGVQSRAAAISSALLLLCSILRLFHNLIPVTDRLLHSSVAYRHQVDRNKSRIWSSCLTQYRTAVLHRDMPRRSNRNPCTWTRQSVQSRPGGQCTHPPGIPPRTLDGCSGYRLWISYRQRRCSPTHYQLCAIRRPKPRSPAAIVILQAGYFYPCRLPDRFYNPNRHLHQR